MVNEALMEMGKTVGKGREKKGLWERGSRGVGMGESVGSSPLKKRREVAGFKRATIPPRGKISCSVPRSVSAIDGEKTAVHRTSDSISYERFAGKEEVKGSLRVFSSFSHFPISFPSLFTATCNEGNTLSTISQDHSSR